MFGRTSDPTLVTCTFPAGDICPTEVAPSAADPVRLFRGFRGDPVLH